MYFTYLKHEEMLSRRIEEYTADMTLLIKFKKITGKKKKFAQNMEVPVSLMNFYSKLKGSLVGFFVWNFRFFDCF